jgi:hypothetical protein
MRFYRDLFPEEERQAIKLLRNYKNLLHVDDDMVLWFRQPPELEGRRIKAVGIALGKAVVMPSSGFYGEKCHRFYFEDYANQDLKMELVQYMITEARLDYEYRTVMEALSKVFDVCNTFGQIIRIWPSLEPMLTEHAREKIKRQKVKSRLPWQVYEVGPAEPGSLCEGDEDEKVDRSNWVLKPEFREDVLRPYNHLIAESYLFPEVENFERNVTLAT